jgi:methylenetetrahydrofolate dehydrogenase (NADP+) / methenyltetrahydrofolate cyclohydrolase
MIIDGKNIAQKIVERLKSLPRPEKFFGAVLVGDDPASVNFLKQKERVAKELDVEFRLYPLSESLSTDDLRREIGRLAEPKPCGGFIVQLPLPEKINRHYVLNAIPKEKDADCLSEAALGAFYTERGIIVPPSVAAVEEILRGAGVMHDGGTNSLRRLKAVVVGAGFLIGKPVGFWLQNKVAELVVFDATVGHLHEKLGDADIIVSGAGHPNLFGANHVKAGALVIDFGFSQSDGKIAGDFNPDGAEAKGIHYTKTPGGTGPILVAKLFENFYALNAKK